MVQYNMRKFFVSTILLLSLVIGYGQGNLFTLEDAVLNRKLYPSSLGNVQFLPSGQYYCFTPQQGDALFIERIDKIATDSSISINVINEGLKKLGKKAMNRFPSIWWITDDEFMFKWEQSFFTFDRTLKSVAMHMQFPENYEHIEWNNQKTACVFSRKHNLYLLVKGKGELQITTDGGNGIVYGETVHRSEFGITKGVFWSADGTRFAFYRMDERAVADYAIFNNNQMPATVHMIKYPFAGKTSHSVKVGIYDLGLRAYHYLRVEGPSDQYLTNVSWSPDGNFVYLAKVSRNQKNMWLERYWARDGAIDMVVAEEFNEKYVEPENPVYFLPWDSTLFLWQSERDGYNHVYLYNTRGKMVKQLTSGPWVVTGIAGFNKQEGVIYVHGTKDGPLEEHLYGVFMESGKTRKISRERGQHQVKVNSSGTFFIDQYNSLTVPLNIDLLSETGAFLRNIHESPNPLKGYVLGETSLFPINNKGVSLYARMIKPVDFDPSKQYPVVVYVYGGPHVQLVKNAWLGASNLWMQFLAQQGFIVFTIDNRGSLNRGFGFESAVHKKLGELEMDDQLAGVDYLKSLPFVDASRIGVHGWSFGGFMTTSLMTRAPGVFKMGVAGGPVIDWSMYEIMYTERYMETPELNKEGYERANLLNYVDKLDAKLLMIHGCDDDVVLWQHSLLYVQKAVDANKTGLDYFVYPGHKHNVYGKDRLHLMSKITSYIFDHL